MEAFFKLAVALSTLELDAFRTVLRFRDGPDDVDATSQGFDDSVVAGATLAVDDVGCLAVSTI